MELFTDKLGLTSFYLLESDGVTFFSSRLDWLVYFYDASISNEQFSLKLHTKYHYQTETILKKVRVLCHSAHAIISTKNKISTQFWLPQIYQYSYEDLIYKMKSFLSAINKPLSLGLSGGLDSRTLLALFSPNNNLKCHTFAERNNPDLTIPENICHQEKITHKVFHYFPQECNNLFSKAQDLTLKSESKISFSSVQLYDFLSELNQMNLCLLDGAYFAFMRRASSNIMIMRNKKKWQNNDFSDAYNAFKGKVFRVVNPSFINEEYMRDYFSDRIKEMPDIKKIGVEKWVDILNMRYKLSPLFSPTERIFDELLPNINFGTNHFLMDYFFSIPLKIKSHCRLNVKIITDFNKKLRHFQYARWNTSTPIIRGKYMPFIYSKIKKMCGGEFKPQIFKKTMILLKEDLLDLYQNSEIDSTYFDISFIKKEMEKMKNGQSYNMREIEQWFKMQTWINHISQNKNILNPSKFRGVQ